MHKFFFERILLVILLFLFCASSRSQNVVYTKQDQRNNYFVDVIETTQGNYLISNANFEADISNSIFTYTSNLILISNTGQLLNSITLPANFFIQGLVSHNNQYFVTGVQTKLNNSTNARNYLKVLTFNSLLQNIGNKTLDSIPAVNYSEFITTRAVIQNNRVFILSGFNNSNGLTIFKTDLNITILDTINFGSTSPVFSNFAGLGKNIYVTALDITPSNFGNRLQIAKLDTSLNLNLPIISLDSITTFSSPGWPGPNGCQQTNVAMFPFAQVIPVSETKLIVSGCGAVVYGTCNNFDQQHLLCSLTPQNNAKALPKIIGKSGGSNEFIYLGNTSSISMRYNRIFHAMVSGSVQSQPLPYNQRTEIYMSKTDTMNNILWTKYLGDTSYSYVPFSTYATVDSGAVISGMRYNFLSPQVNNIGEGFVMKVNKDGNVLFTSIIEHPVNTNFKVAPNPVTDKIQFLNNSSGNFAVKIYNLSGQIVFMNNSLTSEDQIDFSNQPPGAYFYVINESGKLSTGKIIVNR